ncbi:hypothetical protein BDZ97DRAFT_1761616 [Flammula alnicola]|nr:hypothetical protein BDZ97DRAFT_1761616 [Flammula alnicola]
MIPEKDFNTPKMNKQPNVIWRDPDKEILVRVLDEQKDTCRNPLGADWRQAVWTVIKVAIQTEGVLVNDDPKTSFRVKIEVRRKLARIRAVVAMKTAQEKQRACKTFNSRCI